MTMQNNSLRGSGNAEVQAIKDDLSSLKGDATALKNDATTLARDLRDGGGSVAREGIDQLRTSGERYYQDVEGRVRAEPGKSILLAFAAGLAASFILRARR